MQSAVPTACKPSSGRMFSHRENSARRFASRTPLPTGEGLEAAGDSAVAPTKSEAAVGEKKREAGASLFALRAGGGSKPPPYEFVRIPHISVGVGTSTTRRTDAKAGGQWPPLRNRKWLSAKEKQPAKGCFSVCAFFTPHHFARYSAAAIRVKITHASERAISSFGR